MTDTIRVLRTPKTKDRPYFSMSRASAQNTELSFEARGMLAYLLSKPDDWKVQPKDLQQKCGRDKVYKVLNELIAAGYIVRNTLVDEKTGKRQGVEYQVYEEPLPDLPDTVLPDTVNTDNTYNREKKQKTEEHYAPEGAMNSYHSDSFTFKTSKPNCTYWNEYSEALNFLRECHGTSTTMYPVPTNEGELKSVIGAHKDLHRAGLVSALAIANYVAWLQAKYSRFNGIAWSLMSDQISVYKSQQNTHTPDGKRKITAKDILGTMEIIS